MKKVKKNIVKADMERPRTFLGMLGKVGILAGIVLSIVMVLEWRQIFVEDSTNNHVDWKWDWYGRLNRSNIPVDVLLVGNSHILTGLYPAVFNKQSGLSSYMLGAPGVGVADLYYVIEEAFRINKPSILVLETYAINDLEPFELEKGALNDQITSFRARKNNFSKFLSTFSLFHYHNYLIAWFDTFRNHNFIFTKPEQVVRNLKGDGPVRRVRDKLYLGQFARFQKGLSENTLKRYEDEGAPVDGADYRVSESSIKYTRKIAELCKENDVKLVFLTIPMYHEHVENYPMWKSSLSSHIKELSPYWLDLQAADLLEIYTPEAFQDTYSANQHLSNHGMKITAGILAQYITKTFPK